jgi:hypothetical protein
VRREGGRRRRLTLDRAAVVVVEVWVWVWVWVWVLKVGILWKLRLEMLGCWWVFGFWGVMGIREERIERASWLLQYNVAV